MRRRFEKARFEFASTRHTHSPHNTRDARYPNARYPPLFLSFLSLLRSSFEFPLSPRRREENCSSHLILATLSLLSATMSVSRAFPSTLLASPASTRDLFTNPSRSTIPANWLPARRDRRRAQRNTDRCQQVSPNERLSLAGTFYGVRQLRVMSRAHAHVVGVVDEHLGRPRIVVRTRACTRTTAHSIHVPPWGISAIADSCIRST